MSFLRKKSLPEKFRNIKSLQSMPDDYFKVGNQVRVIDNLEYVKYIQNNRGGGWTHEMKECLNMVCTIDSIDPDAMIRVITETGKKWFFHKASLESNLPETPSENSMKNTLKGILNSSFHMESPPVTLTPPKETIHFTKVHPAEIPNSTLNLISIDSDDSVSCSLSLETPPSTLTPPKETNTFQKKFHPDKMSDSTLNLMSIHDSVRRSLSLVTPPSTLTPPKETNTFQKKFHPDKMSDSTLNLMSVHDSVKNKAIGQKELENLKKF